MTQDEQHASELVATCAKEASAHILAYAREAESMMTDGLDA